MIRILCALSVLAGASATPAAARALPKNVTAPDDRPCPEIGDGFVRLAGSDTCVKLGGSLRVETMRRSGGTSFTAGAR